MNILTANPDAARTVAQHLIAERVRDAEQARTARAVRRQQRAVGVDRQQPTAGPLPRWTLRFLHPAH
jgi:hypothetical protein